MIAAGHVHGRHLLVGPHARPAHRPTFAGSRTVLGVARDLRVDAVDAALGEIPLGDPVGVAPRVVDLQLIAGVPDHHQLVGLTPSWVENGTG